MTNYLILISRHRGYFFLNFSFTKAKLLTPDWSCGENTYCLRCTFLRLLETKSYKITRTNTGTKQSQFALWIEYVSNASKTVSLESLVSCTQ